MFADYLHFAFFQAIHDIKIVPTFSKSGHMQSGLVR